MLLTRVQKEEQVQKMTESMDKSKSIILVNYQGLKNNEIETLKKNLREQGIGFQITKNTLFKIALKNAGLVIEDSLLDQPVAVIWGADDEVTPAKLAVSFKKEAEQLEIIGGIVNNQFADENTIKQLAALPGREELYAKLVGTLNAPMFRLVNALQGNLRSLVYILEQYKNSRN